MYLPRHHSVSTETSPLLNEPERQLQNSEIAAPKNAWSKLKDSFEHVPDASAAVLGGLLGFAGGYALTQGLFTLRARAPVPAPGDYWSELARSLVYGRCYQGCSSVDVGTDVGAWLDCPQEACAISALAFVGNTSCDARPMWFWQNREPEACLAPLGVILRERALEDISRHSRHHEILAIFVGLGLAWAGAVAALNAKRRWS